ncbi:MAG: TrmB family transcriptional regulator [Methanoregula sp.]|jgi:sugar-specific transcriptional regulator TrmB|nr:TrmB family transcriptional regulator [Methanoregula sp.]
MKLPSENPVRVIECLKSLGLTKYEALVYIALLKVVTATASEIHEISGVPRASVYTVINQIIDKGLVSVSQSAPKRFAAIPPEDVITRLMGRIEKDAQYARDSLSSVYRERMNPGLGTEELIWNIYGIENIKKRFTDLISGAKREIRIIAHPQFLTNDIKQKLTSRANQINIEIISPHWVGEIPKKLSVFIIKPPEIPKEFDKAKDMMAGGVCIIDGRYVIVILGLGEADAVALFSESEGFVRFFVRYYALIFDWAKKTGMKEATGD